MNYATMPCSATYLERATDAGTRSPIAAIAREQDDAEIAKRAWRAERRDELESDTGALLDALDADSRIELLRDVINAMRDRNDAHTSADRLILRYGDVDSHIEAAIKATLDREEALGRWHDYIAAPEAVGA